MKKQRLILFLGLGFAALGLSSCKSSGNLYFLSAQRIGLELSASDPASNAAPKVLIGYESIKGAINPVKNDDGTLRDEAYSVLGITNVDVKGTANAGLAAAEWFATGPAAKILAQNPLTPVALTGSMTLTPEVLKLANAKQLARTVNAINSASKFIRTQATKTSAEEKLLKNLDGLDRLVDGLDFMTFDAAGNETPYVPPPLTGTSAVTGWQRVMTARSDLQDSITRAKNLILTSDEDEVKKRAKAAAENMRGILRQFDSEILQSEPAHAIWSYLTDWVNSGGD